MFPSVYPKQYVIFVFTALICSVYYYGCAGVSAVSDGDATIQRPPRDTAAFRAAYNAYALSRYIDGLIHQMSNETATSIYDFESALRADSSETIWASLAEAYVDQGDLTRGQETLERLLARHPENADALKILSSVYISLSRFKEAAETLEKVIRIDSVYPEGRYQLITLNDMLGRSANNIPHYAFLLRYNGPNTYLSLKLANIYLRQKQHGPAIEILEQARSHDPNNSFLLETLAQAYLFNKQNKLALECYEQLNKIKPKDLQTLLRMGAIAIQTGDNEKAVRYFEAAEPLSSPSFELQRNLGWAYFQLKNRDKAVQHLEQALQMNPRDVLTLSLLSGIYQEQKQYDQSDALFERLLVLDPANEVILNNYSYSLAVRGLQTDKAMRLIKKALEKSPDNPHYLDTMGWVYFQMGQYDAALKYVRRSYEINAASWEVADHLGDIYYKLNDPRQARHFWRKAIELGGDKKIIEEKIEASSTSSSD